MKFTYEQIGLGVLITGTLIFTAVYNARYKQPAFVFVQNLDRSLSKFTVGPDGNLTPATGYVEVNNGDFRIGMNRYDALRKSL